MKKTLIDVLVKPVLYSNLFYQVMKGENAAAVTTKILRKRIDGEIEGHIDKKIDE